MEGLLGSCHGSSVVERQTQSRETEFKLHITAILMPDQFHSLHTASVQKLHK